MSPSERHIKKPKTYKQQIDILKNRNLIINNVEEAVTFLKRVNYYRFSAYGLTLKQKENSDLFLDGVTFHQIKMVYIFDQKLRELLISQLEPVEIEFRSKIAYHHAHKFSALGYKDSANFKDESMHTKFLGELYQQIDKSKKELLVNKCQAPKQF
ncbi:Abi family protein [Lentibacillus cibarius]|uniref:Abi family protein n=1 Tax=Lentibacillus cibarius TaxID=2583219 RepID=UPI0014865060|nr:Abi family protein [Lentibacillus cibarius]